MALGEKLFEETGQAMHFRIIKVHPTEGTTMEVSFTSDLKGFGNFPSGKNMGSGVVTQYPHGVVDGSYQGKLDTTAGDQIVWWAHEKGRIANGGKIKSLIIVSAFTNSQKLSPWINDMIMALEAERDPATHHSKTIAYEWK
ncbi:MAG TPA: hypothetical protein VHA09_01915 [Nitrososphaera sp.]|nr:hypothetical protein [Nitrososphaera sp.]